MPKCNCYLVGEDHDEWCNAHPLQIKITKLKRQLAKIREAVLWSGSSDVMPPKADDWQRIIEAVREGELND